MVIAIKKNNFIFSKLILLLSAGAVLLFYPALAIADDYEDYLGLDLESLMNIEVFSASKRAQKISEAPNAIYVITAEDIKRSGAVDLPDLFRMVPGVDVINVYGSFYGVSARGFNDAFAARMLVMIDGRSIYTALFGGVFWENEEVFLEDIKQIEVIRGPGATIWGANAVNGVISIITKDPEEDQGFMVTGKVGTKHFRENVIRYSDSITDRLSFSLTGGYREDEGTRGVNDYRRVPKVTGRLKYKFSDRSTLHFFAGVNESEIGLDITTFTPRTDANVRSNYQMLRFEHRFSDTSQFHLQIYRSYTEFHGSDKSVAVEEGKNDVEIQHSFALGRRNQIVWGASYRGTEVDSVYIHSETAHDDIIGLFLQDELKIFDNLRFVAGVKYERNSFTGGDFSPRGCFLYSPWPDHHFRFSVARALKTPTFIEDGTRLVFTLPSPLPLIPPISYVGNEHLDPEDMTALELGYRTILFNEIGLNVELYYNNLDKVSGSATPIKFWPFHYRADNCYDAIAKGIEVAVDYPITSWWTLKANYTFQELDVKGDNEDIPSEPKHKFNLGSSFTFKNGFSLDVKAHFVDETRWFGMDKFTKTDDYLRLDIRVSQKLFGNKVELSLAGQNITDKLHPETINFPGAYKVERLVYGQVTLWFR